MKLFGFEIQRAQTFKALDPETANRILSGVKHYGISAQFIEDTLDQYIEKGYLMNPDVYSVVKRIASRAASIPLRVYRVQDDDKLKRYKYTKSVATNERRLEYKNEALGEELPGHPLQEVLYNPNPTQTGTELIEAILSFKLITGNSFTLGIGPEAGNNAGQIQELWTLPAHYVKIHKGTSIMEPIAGYSLNIGDTKGQMMPAKDVMHLKYFDPEFDGVKNFYGLSPIKVGSKVVTVSNDTYEANAKLLQNLGAIGMISPSSDAMLDPTQIDQLNKAYQKKFSGPSKYGKAIIASRAMNWQQLGMTVDDLAILESKQYNLRDICNLYGVSSVLFNDNANSTYNNMSVARKDFITDAVLPELDALVNGFNNWLAPSYGEDIYIDYDLKDISELEPDMTALSQRMVNEWWWSPNEKRMMLGKGAIEDDPTMDTIYQPMNLIPLTNESDAS